MWCSSYKARLKLQHSQKSKRKTTRTQVFGSTICPHAAPSFHSTLPKLHKNSLQSERSLAANIYIDARPLIRLMYSCEILILPHDGTTDDTLFVSHSVTAPWYFTTAHVGKTIPRRRSILVLEPLEAGCQRRVCPADSRCSENTLPLSFLPCSYLWTPEEMEPLTLSVGCLSSCNFPRTRWRYMLLPRFDCRSVVILWRHKVGIYNSGWVSLCPLLWPFVFKKLQGFCSAEH